MKYSYFIFILTLLSYFDIPLIALSHYNIPMFGSSESLYLEYGVTKLLLGSNFTSNITCGFSDITLNVLYINQSLIELLLLSNTNYTKYNMICSNDGQIWCSSIPVHIIPNVNSISNIIITQKTNITYLYGYGFSNDSNPYIKFTCSYFMKNQTLIIYNSTTAGFKNPNIKILGSHTLYVSNDGIVYSTSNIKFNYQTISIGLGGENIFVIKIICICAIVLLIVIMTYVVVGIRYCKRERRIHRMQENVVI